MRTLFILSALLAATLVPASVLAHDGAGSLQEFSCGGTAPLGRACNTDLHRFTTSVNHGCRAGPGFTGVVTSVLTSFVDQIREFSCVFRDGALVQSNGQGFWPSAGEQFIHACFTEGVGSWSCYVRHD